MPDPIAAAGFVVVRPRRHSADSAPTGPDFEVLALRNRKHGTWGMPKGTVDPGETIEQAGWRELEEEIGLTADHLAVAPAFLYESSYLVPPNVWGPGRPPEPTPKTATYWLGRILPGAKPALSHEHDRMEWIPRAAIAEHFRDQRGMPELLQAAAEWIDNQPDWLAAT